MPTSLDTLLFWSGLALLSIGLFVFLSGKRASDESKRESNRFEAFGVKIDVNNPSLILIMLGAVMMLAPKFLPQEVTESAVTGPEPAESAADASSDAATPPSTSGSVMPTTVAAMPDAAPSPPPSQPSAQALTRMLPAEPEPEPSPTEAATPAVAATPPRAPLPKAKPIATPQPARVARTVAPVEPQEPAPSTPQPVPAEQPPPPLLVVAVVADVSERAGIRESGESYARRASDAIARRTGEVYSNGLKIDQSTVNDLREHLKKGKEDYAALCGEWQADILVLGDFKIDTGWSTIDSAYWPDYHLHLYNCDTRRARYEVFKHLNPTNRDAFPFEEAINEKTMKFLADSRWVVGD